MSKAIDIIIKAMKNPGVSLHSIVILIKFFLALNEIDESTADSFYSQLGYEDTKTTFELLTEALPEVDESFALDDLVASDLISFFCDTGLLTETEKNTLLSSV